MIEEETNFQIQLKFILYKYNMYKFKFSQCCLQFTSASRQWSTA